MRLRPTVDLPGLAPDCRLARLEWPRLRTLRDRARETPLLLARAAARRLPGAAPLAAVSSRRGTKGRCSQPALPFASTRGRRRPKLEIPVRVRGFRAEFRRGCTSFGRLS